MNPSGRRGVALFLALLVIMIMAIITTSYIFLIRHSARLVSSRQNDAQAFYLAEAGLNKAVWYLTHTAPDGSVDGSWRTAAHEEDLADGKFIIQVEDDSGTVIVTARGIVNDAQRVIRQQFASFFPVSVIANSWQEIGT